MCGGAPEGAETQSPSGGWREKDGIASAYDSRSDANRFRDRYRALQDIQRAVEIAAKSHARRRLEPQHFRGANDGCWPGAVSSAHDQAEIRTASVGDRATGFPLSLEAGAPLCRIEGAVAVPQKPEVEAFSCDQNQRPPVTGVSGELAVSIDVGETQSPGEVLAQRGLPRDLERDSSSVPPGHGSISPVSPDLECRLLLYVARHTPLRGAWSWEAMVCTRSFQLQGLRVL